MDLDHVKASRVVEEDRLSSLPDELIHKILSSFDMKFAVRTSLLSSRWKLVWTSMPHLNFSSEEFRNLSKFAKFINHILSHCNHEIEVSSVKLDFHGAANLVFVRIIANYAFSHNVQELTVANTPIRCIENYPPCLFSSRSLKHFTLSVQEVSSNCISLDTPLNFPALTTMHLNNIQLCGELFSKCVNLKNLTVQDFCLSRMGVLDIITPRLSNLMLIRGYYAKVINLIAPQLENLTVISCRIDNLNAPLGLSSLYYRDCLPQQLSKDGFHSLNKVTMCLSYYSSEYEEDARKTIKMLQELHSAKYLTLSADIIERLSSFPDLLSLHSSPFSNIHCLTIDYSMRKDAYKVNMFSRAINFLLQNSPNAKLIMEPPKGSK